jgi:hypothetical protein
MNEIGTSKVMVDVCEDRSVIDLLTSNQFLDSRSHGVFCDLRLGAQLCNVEKAQRQLRYAGQMKCSKGVEGQVISAPVVFGLVHSSSDLPEAITRGQFDAI